MGADRENLNVKSAAIHVLGDLLGSVAALAAGAVILLTGWTPIDPLLSILVAVIVLRSGWKVVEASGHILLEGAPHELDTRHIEPDLVANVPGWSACTMCMCGRSPQERQMVTLHACVDEGLEGDRMVKAIKERLHTALRPGPRHRRDRARRLCRCRRRSEAAPKDD